jgi:hypothetical protein
MTKDQHVVCAAIRLKLGVVVCGPRHFDATMRKVIEKLRLTVCDAEQGFVDQFGEFLTREQAWDIAKARGQIRTDNGICTGTLYSEDLY